MADETPSEKHARLKAEFAQKSNEELVEIYERMRRSPGIAGSFILIITVVKDELMARGLLEN